MSKMAELLSNFDNLVLVIPYIGSECAMHVSASPLMVQIRQSVVISQAKRSTMPSRLLPV